MGENSKDKDLEPARESAKGQDLTTNQGIPVADNQNSLKAGERGPTLLEDFILREKITHFDHERIPERVVHARGSAAHGYFEVTTSMAKYTKAKFLQDPGTRTPVFVRFSTVAGSRGSADTARDVRGFATKFYTEEGIWDLVGNNIPVFFIQDAMKFPDVVHAVKPEPHHEMPQAASAHDNFWDFIGLTPESLHMVMWQMSDRTIPRSFRMMEGFGVNTFRLINADGKSVFVKFHWKPVLGVHSLVWDEAQKLAGKDPDFHRRDLWENIELGSFPEWQFGIQVLEEADELKFDFDPLDPTKVWPETLIPVQIFGKLVLNRNPDNFFAETEQVAYCPANVVPGIDFSNDPLLQGRLFSYLDTQLSRLGSPNFHELPINRPISPVHNNNQDGHMRHTIKTGRVNYQPNSLGGGCPMQLGRPGQPPEASAGFSSYPERIDGHKVRARSVSFSDHFTQATMFWNSQTEVEKEHIIDAFRFELTRVETLAIRIRMVAGLVNVDATLAHAVACGLGIAVPPPLPLATSLPLPNYAPSPALSLLSRPGVTGIRTRQVAIFVASGADGAAVRAVYAALLDAGAVPRLVGQRLGQVSSLDGVPLHVETTVDVTPSVVYDAMVAPGGDDGVIALGRDARVIDFVREQYRHGKPILALGSGAGLLSAAGIPATLPDGCDDPGIISMDPALATLAIGQFKQALARHRTFERVTDPPAV